MRGVRRFTDLRAWQACDAYKKAVYRICLETPLARDWRRKDQLETSVAGPPAHIAEGFGRFNPADFAKFTVYARSSLMESQNHLRDALDKRYISEELFTEVNTLADAALAEVTGLMDYLQSPDALKNARSARARRVANRQTRKARRLSDPSGGDAPQTPNSEPET